MNFLKSIARRILATELAEADVKAAANMSESFKNGQAAEKAFVQSDTKVRFNIATAELEGFVHLYKNAFLIGILGEDHAAQLIAAAKTAIIAEKNVVKRKALVRFVVKSKISENRKEFTEIATELALILATQ